MPALGRLPAAPALLAAPPVAEPCAEPELAVPEVEPVVLEVEPAAPAEPADAFVLPVPLPMPGWPVCPGMVAAGGVTGGGPALGGLCGGCCGDGRTDGG